MSRYGHYGQPVRLHDEPKRAQLKEVMTTYELTSPIAAIFAYHGTILPLVARRAEAWIFVGVHVILLVLNDVAGLIDIDVFLGVDPLKTMGILTALLSFFIVYFTSQSLARFTTFYQSCTGISGSLQQIASQTSVHLADYPVERWDACRYMLSAACLVYMKVTDAGTQTIDADEWQRLMLPEAEWSGRPAILGGRKVDCPPLLTEEEVVHLQAFPGNPSSLLCTWAMHVLRRGMRRAGCEAPLIVEMQENTVNLQKAMGAIVNTLAMPVPYPYFHLLNLLLFVNYMVTPHAA